MEDNKLYVKFYTIDSIRDSVTGTKNTVWKSPCAKTVERINVSYEGNSCEINMPNQVPPSELRRLCICFDFTYMSLANKTQGEWMLSVPE